MSATAPSRLVEPESLTAARRYLERGYPPVPIPRRKKGPVVRGWQDLRLTAADLPAHFGDGGNVGLLLGSASGLVDVDLDCEAARALAPAFLPATGMIHGRPGARRSHWWYAPDEVSSATRRFRDPAGETLVELRSSGCQTLVPPSVHPNGEQLTWETFEEPEKVDLGVLETAVRRLAAASLLARSWPSAGSRQEAALALAGALLRTGWSQEEVAGFVRAVAGAAGDEEAEKRGRAVNDTAAALKSGRNTTGLPALARIFGEKVAGLVRKLVLSGAFPDPAPRPGTTDLLLDPSDPLPSARRFLSDHHEVEGTSVLHYHRGEFFRWSGACYPPLGEDGLKADLYRFLERAKILRRRGETATLEWFKPTAAKVANVLDALRAVAYLDAGLAPPLWLPPAAGPDPRDLVSCRNGILDLPTGSLLPHSPAFFTLNALDFDYRPDAGPPERWLAFLRELWPDDEETVVALQEWMGVVALSDATEYQKVLLVVGPKRSGKGTIGRVLTALAGAANVCAPTLASLGTNFGLWPLVGKRLALVSDARLGGRADQHMIVERLLSISGEDSVTVDRKFREPWTGRLAVRFVILTNELPKFADASVALASRFVILALNRSFYGQEDPDLLRKLLPELPGILVWAREGLLRLRARGRLLQPSSALDLVRDLEDLSSPIAAFVRDRCVIGPEHQVEVGALYEAWKGWCEEQGRDHPGTAQSFGRDLRAAVPAVRRVRPRTPGGDRVRAYAGIRPVDERERSRAESEEGSGPRWSAVPTIARVGGVGSGEGEEEKREHKGVGRGPSRTTPFFDSIPEAEYARQERLGIQEYGG